MNTIRVAATKAKNDFFNLLEQVIAGVEIVIEKDNKEVAVLRPKKGNKKWEALLKATKESAGILKDEPYDPNDNPLRRPGAADFLGKWDQGLKENTK